jgi:hypothetical protein
MSADSSEDDDDNNSKEDIEIDPNHEKMSIPFVYMVKRSKQLKVETSILVVPPKSDIASASVFDKEEKRSKKIIRNIKICQEDIEAMHKVQESDHIKISADGFNMLLDTITKVKVF